MDTDAIHSRAADKAFAKITVLTIKIHDLTRNIHTGRLGNITIEQATDVLLHLVKDLRTWNYILETIEKSNRS